MYQLVRILCELFHEVRCLLSSRAHDTPLHITNTLRVLKLRRLIDCPELVLHLLFLSLLFLHFLTEIFSDLVSENVFNGLSEELGVGQILVLEEFGNESVRRICIVNSLLSDFNLIANLSEQTSSRLFSNFDFFTSDEFACLLKVLLVYKEEAASGTSLPPLVSLDLTGQLLKNRFQSVSVIAIKDDNV